MIDIALHRRCMSQPVRERRLMSAKIKHWAANQPSDQYIAPELVEEILEMRIPFPVTAKTRKLDGAVAVELEPVLNRESYWTKFCECWARMGSR